MCPDSTFSLATSGKEVMDICDSGNENFTQSAFFVEVIATFLFASAVLSLKGHYAPLEKAYTAICLAFSLVGASMVGYNNSGPALNPVIGIVNTGITDWMLRTLHLQENNHGHISKRLFASYNMIGVFMIAPLIGGLIAGAYYRMTNNVIKNW